MALVSNTQQKTVENEMRQLEKQVEAMDGKLRAYLADRQNKAHPRHQELIEKIQRYRIPPAISNKQLESQLDNLQWKVFYHKKAWQQLWENAEAAYRQGRRFGSMNPPGPSPSEQDDTESQSSSSIHRYWKLQQKKLNELGEKNSETVDAFENRIKKRYRQLSSAKGDDQEVVMTFSKKEKKCTLELKKKG